MERWLVLAVLVLIFSIWCEGASTRGAGMWDPAIRLPSEKEVSEEESEDEIGTRWAVLVAGSMGFGNYRHQVSLAFNFWVFLFRFVPNFLIWDQTRFACHWNLCYSAWAKFYFVSYKWSIMLKVNYLIVDTVCPTEQNQCYIKLPDVYFIHYLS